MAEGAPETVKCTDCGDKGSRVHAGSWSACGCVARRLQAVERELHTLQEKVAALITPGTHDVEDL